MRKLFKWTLGSVLFLICAVLLLGLLAFAVLRNTVPAANSVVALSGLNKSVEVVFDKEAIPHISAMDYEDAVRALGYIHARDRL